MPNEIHTIEGIVVKSLDYEDNKRIFTLFTKEGLMSFITSLKASEPHRRLLSSFLSKGEYCYSLTKGSLKKIKDASLISTQLNYERSFEHMEAASLLLYAVSRSQMEEKPSPLLYALLNFYLEKLSKQTDPYLFTSSFMLKLLLHEGLFEPSLVCSRCNKCLPLFFQNGESVCKNCAASNSICFSEEESKMIYVLTYSKQMAQLSGLIASKEFHLKIKGLFDSYFEQKCERGDLNPQEG